MDACRREIGVKAAQIIANYHSGEDTNDGQMVTLSPKLAFGDTLRRRG